jgi:transposase-like protein
VFRKAFVPFMGDQGEINEEQSARSRGIYMMRRAQQAFRQMAVERLNQCENIVALSQELGVSRRLLYTWRDQLDPVERSEGPPATARESTLRKEVSQLKRLLAEKMLEVDFFKGALHTVEARRQRTGTSGAPASTPTSGT